MTRRHKRNRQNQKNRSQATQARLSMENLEPRQLMTASPVMGPLAQVNLNNSNLTGHLPRQNAAVVSQMDNSELSLKQAASCYNVSVTQQGKTIKISGTSCDDFVEVSQPDKEHVKVTVYEDQERKTVQSTKTFKTSAVTSVVFDGKAGDDYLWNGHEGMVTVTLPFGGPSGTGVVKQHSLPTTAYGGTGNDHLEGSLVDDFLYGGPGDDTIYGNAGVDEIKGDADPLRPSPSTMPDGDDILNGGSGIDRLWGEGGDDTLRGGKGADWLFGNTGDDSLYGEGGDDHLFGQKGLDGLFGGAGKDKLDGGSGPDRYLKHNSGDSFKMKTGDQKIKFKDSGAKTVCSTDFGPGTWSDRDVEAVDEALKVIHHEMGNTELLDGFTMNRLGSRRSGDILACHRKQPGSDSIWIPNVALNSAATVHAVIHEIGHVFNPKNSQWKEWKSFSNWTKNPPKPYVMSTKGFGSYSAHSKSAGPAALLPADLIAEPHGKSLVSAGLTPTLLPNWHKGHVASKWSYYGSPGFITEYASYNPLDDFAETFSAAFLPRTSYSWMTGSIWDAYDSSAMKDKHDFMENWLDTKRS